MPASMEQTQQDQRHSEVELAKSVIISQIARGGTDTIELTPAG